MAYNALDHLPLTPGQIRGQQMPTAVPAAPAPAPAAKLSPFGDPVAPAAAPQAKVSPFGDPAAPVAPKLAFAPGKGTEVSENVVDETGKSLVYRGEVNNLTAGLNNALYTALGYPVDAARNAINDVVIAKNFFTGQPLAANTIPDDNVGGKNWISQQFEKIGVHDPDKTVAATLSEKLSHLAGEGAGMTIAPELFVKTLGEVGITGPKATELLQALAGDGSSAKGIVKNAVVGATANTAGGLAAENAPDNLKPVVQVAAGLAGGMGGASALEGVPRLARAGARTARDIVAPLSEGGRERLAGERLAAAADDPAAAKQAIRDSAPGVDGEQTQLTTGQLTGDKGILAEERVAAAKDPATFAQRREEQNATRLKVTRDLQATGSPETVASAVRAHIEEVQKTSDAAIEAAQREAETHVAKTRQSSEANVQQHADEARAQADNIGQGSAPEVAGEAIRSRYEAARAAAKVDERRIWRAVDPENRLRLGTTHTTDGAARIFGDIPTTAKPPEGEEAAIFKTAQDMPATAPLGDVTALQSRIKAQMRIERMQGGETTAFRRLSMLNEQVQNDLETAITHKVAEERQAVAEGRMSVEDTLLHRLQREVSGWYAERDASRATGSDSASAVSARGPSAPAEPPRAPGEAQSGSGDAGGGEGLSPDAGPETPPETRFDDAALERLTAARAATKQRVETFDNKTLAPLRRRPSTTSPYDVPDAVVPGRIFHSRPGSADAIEKLRGAIGDQETLTQLEPYAIDRLRRTAMNDDGTLNSAKAETWLRNHSDALKAFPELEARVRRAASSSRALADASKAAKETVAQAEKDAKANNGKAVREAKDRVDEEQAGSIGKIMHADSPEEVVTRVGHIFGRPDAAREMARLRRATHGDKDAVEGLRKAVVDYMLKKFVGNTESGTSELGTMKSDQFQTFVRDNKPALRAAGFSDPEIATMGRVADDLQKANRSIVAVKNPGGSNTTQDSFAVGKGKIRSLLELLAVPLITEGGVHALNGPVAGVTAGVAAGLFAALRAAGVRKVDDLVKDALLDPRLALRLMSKVRPGAETNKAAHGLAEVLAPSNLIAATKSITGDRRAHV